MVIGASEKFPRFGQMFFEAGPCQGGARLAAYFDRQVAAGRLAIEDTALAAQHFLDLCQSGTLRRLLFAVGEPPTGAEIAYFRRPGDEGVLRGLRAEGVNGAIRDLRPGSRVS